MCCFYVYFFILSFFLSIFLDSNAHSKVNEEKKRLPALSMIAIYNVTSWTGSASGCYWLPMFGCYCWHNHILSKAKYPHVYHKIGQSNSSSHGAVVNFKLLSKWKIAIVVCFHFSVLFFFLFFYRVDTMNRIYWMLFNVTYSLHSLLSNRFSRRRGHTKNKMKNTHGSAGMEWIGMMEWKNEETCWTEKKESIKLPSVFKLKNT